MITVGLLNSMSSSRLCRNMLGSHPFLRFATLSITPVFHFVIHLLASFIYTYVYLSFCSTSRTLHDWMTIAWKVIFHYIHLLFFSLLFYNLHWIWNILRMMFLIVTRFVFWMISFQTLLFFFHSTHFPIFRWSNGTSVLHSSNILCIVHDFCMRGQILFSVFLFCFSSLLPLIQVFKYSIILVFLRISSVPHFESRSGGCRWTLQTIKIRHTTKKDALELHPEPNAFLEKSNGMMLSK